jgi:Putative beta-barrel porin 2
MNIVRLTGLVLLLGHAAPAQAQIAAPRESAQIEFGSLSLYPSVRVADAGIDENVFNDGSAPKQDVTFTLSSQALAVWRVGLNELLFSSGSDYVWFKTYESERSSNMNYAMRFNLSASRFKPYVGAQLTHTRTRPTPEIDTRARRATRVALAGTNFELTERTAITASAQWDETNYDEGEQFRGIDLAERMSHVGRTYNGGFRYAVTPFTTVSVNGGYRNQIFPQSHLRDSQYYRITPRVDFAPEAVIRGSFAAGYEAFIPDDPELARTHGVVLEGALNWMIASMTTFDLTVGRNVNYSYLDSDPYYLQTGARLTVSQQLVGPFGLQGTADRQHLSYRWRRGVAPTPGFEPRADTLDVFSAGVVVQVGRGIAVMVGAERAKRHSSEDAKQNYRRMRLVSGVTVGK